MSRAQVARKALDRRGALGLLGGGASAAWLAACGQSGSSAGESSDSGKPIVNVDSFGSTGIDPIADVQNLVKWGMGEPLARVSRKSDIEPWLATSWKNVDPLRWELMIREGVH